MMYRLEMTGEEPNILVQSFKEMSEEESEKALDYAETIFIGAAYKIKANDQIVISSLKKDWSMDRLGEIEKCIFRVALHELLTMDAPHFAVIDDFVTITKNYTDEKVASFVNGVLNNVYNQFKEEK